MSAPRKIWVPVPVTDEGPCYVDKDEAEMQWGCASTAYHHDDVVRELAYCLEVAVLWLEFDGRYDVQGMKAALSKIAPYA